MRAILPPAGRQPAPRRRPLHSQFLPPDDLTLRGSADQPAIAASHRLFGGGWCPAPVRPATDPDHLVVADAPQGQTLSKGATINQVLVNFDGESKSLKKPVYDDKSRTLSLNYPVSDYRVVMDLLRNETVYVQFLTYANGHIWADLHTGTVRTR
jgi:hypothetical protein